MSPGLDEYRIPAVTMALFLWAQSTAPFALRLAPFELCLL